MPNYLISKPRIILWILAAITCFALGWYGAVSRKYEFGAIAAVFAAFKYGCIFYLLDLIVTFLKKPNSEFNKFQIAIMGIIIILICPAASMLGFGIANFFTK